MKITHLVFASLIAFVLVSCGGKVKENPKYNYISAEETAELMRKDASKLVLVDIQEKPDFEEEHLKGALATYAYPVKTEDEKARSFKSNSVFLGVQRVVSFKGTTRWF